MICKPCALGADVIAIHGTPGWIAVGRKQHEKCNGCDCQHRVDLQVEGRSVRT